MSYQLQRVSVLVIEDNQPMLDLTKSILMAFGAGFVTGARDGRDGLEIYRKYRPDIIVADWMMKPVDGISLTRQIRNDIRGNPYTPIILMTGFSEKRRVEQARDAGVNEFLVKPFSAHELYRRMVQIIERPRQFVRAPDFFGPDRRRREDPAYAGPPRRTEDRSVRRNALRTQEDLITGVVEPAPDTYALIG